MPANRARDIEELNGNLHSERAATSQKAEEVAIAAAKQQVHEAKAGALVRRHLVQQGLIVPAGLSAGVVSSESLRVGYVAAERFGDGSPEFMAATERMLDAAMANADLASIDLRVKRLQAKGIDPPVDEIAVEELLAQHLPGEEMRALSTDEQQLSADALRTRSVQVPYDNAKLDEMIRQHLAHIPLDERKLAVVVDGALDSEELAALRKEEAKARASAARTALRMEKLLEKGVALSDELLLDVQSAEPWALQELERLVEHHLTPIEVTGVGQLEAAGLQMIEEDAQAKGGAATEAALPEGVRRGSSMAASEWCAGAAMRSMQAADDPPVEPGEHMAYGMGEEGAKSLISIIPASSPHLLQLERFVLLTDEGAVVVRARLNGTIAYLKRQLSTQLHISPRLALTISDASSGVGAPLADDAIIAPYAEGRNAQRLLLSAAPRPLSDFLPGAAALPQLRQVRVRLIVRGALDSNTVVVRGVGGATTVRDLQCALSIHPVLPSVVHEIASENLVLYFSPVFITPDVLLGHKEKHQLSPNQTLGSAQVIDDDILYLAVG